MKKVFATIIFLAGMLPAMALNKSAKLLEHVFYGMHYSTLVQLLGEPINKSVLKSGETRCVYMLSDETSLSAGSPYYIMLKDDVVVEKGTTNHNNSDMRPIPFAKQETSNDRVDRNTNSVDHLVTIQVPRYFSLKDKIYICNHSQYPILRTVVVSGEDHNMVIGSCSFLQINDCAEIADYPGNGLATLQGAKIAIKAKGTTNTNVVSLQNIQGDNDQSDYITYDFDVSVAEHNHDLYIYLYTNNADIEDTSTGADPLDF